MKNTKGLMISEPLDLCSANPFRGLMSCGTRDERETKLKLKSDGILYSCLNETFRAGLRYLGLLI